MEGSKNTVRLYFEKSFRHGRQLERGLSALLLLFEFLQIPDDLSHASLSVSGIPGLVVVQPPRRVLQLIRAHVLDQRVRRPSPTNARG